MNKSLLFSCLLASTLVFAQTPAQTPPVAPVAPAQPAAQAETATPAPAPAATETATPAPAPAEPAPVAPPPPPPPPPPPVVAPAPEPAPVASEGTIFDQVRGHAYNPYATAGAANNVLDLVGTPSDIFGQKFVYISPTILDNAGYMGYTAFGLGSGTALLGLDNSEAGSVAALILGYANSAFGLAFDISLSKVWESDDNRDVSTRTTNPGDNIGVYFSLPVGLYAGVQWLTYCESYSQDNPGSPDEVVDCSRITGGIGFQKASGSLTYDLGLAVERSGRSVTRGGNKLVDADTYLLTALYNRLGYAALQSSTARAIIGLNSAFGIQFRDKVGNVDGDNIIVLSLSPNILAEVALTKNLLAFAGATHSLDFGFGDLDRNDDTHQTVISHTPGTEAFAGLRYQRANWALEAEVAANPFELFIGNNIFASFGGFVYF